MECELAAAWKATAERVEVLRKMEEEKEALRIEVERLRKESEKAERLRKEKESVEGKLEESEQENAYLKKEIEELQSGLAAQKKELEGEYQTQVDEMYFVGYRCCMKKNDITHDIPSFLSDDEDDATDGSS